MNNDAYLINKEFVVYEQMDVELTVINLQKGFYFIGKDSAIDIFLMLEEAASIDTIVQKILSIYDAQEATVREEVTSLIEQWTSNDLISQVDDYPEALSMEPGTATDRKPWTRPIFIAFDNMRDLLLLDPIHETELDQQGWPVAANNAGNQ